MIGFQQKNVLTCTTSVWWYIQAPTEHGVFICRPWPAMMFVFEALFASDKHKGNIKFMIYSFTDLLYCHVIWNIYISNVFPFDYFTNYDDSNFLINVSMNHGIVQVIPIAEEFIILFPMYNWHRRGCVTDARVNL